MLLNIIKQLLSWLFNKQQKLESQITQEYDAMTKEMRSMLSEVYEKYAVNGELTYSEMSKYSRLDGLIKKIDKMTGERFKAIYETMYGSLSDTFEEHFIRMAHGIEQTANQKVGYTPIKKDTIRKMILNPIDGLTLSDRLEKRRANVIFDIKQEMVQGLSNGETYDKVAKRLVSIFDGDKKKSYRVARTEMHRVSEQAKFSAALKAHENGVKMLKTWKSAHDYHVRDTTEASHVDLDGTTIPIDQNFKQGNGNGLCPGSMGSPDHDIFCRCILIYSLEKYLYVAEPLNDKEKRAINQYISSDAYKINEKLREGIPLDGNDKELIRNLDKALEKLPNYMGDVNRSLFFHDAESMYTFLDDYKIGSTIKYKSYTSTSKDVYDEDDDVRIIIKNSKSGKDLKGYNDKEVEVLYHRNAEFIVRKRYIEDDNIFIVMEEK